MPVSSRDLLSDPLRNYPADTVACFDATTGELPRRQLDAHRNRAFLEKLAEQNVGAVLIAASTGHGHLRTTDELATWIEDSAQANLRDTMKMVLLRPEDGEHESRRLISLVKESDYPVVFVRPGTDLSAGASDEEVTENMAFIVQEAAAKSLAIGVYSIPDVSGVRLTPSATAKLLDKPGGDHIVAVKITEADFANSTQRFLDDPRLSRLKIVQGWDPHLASALKADPIRCGITSGPMSFAAFQYQHILAEAKRENWEEVELAQLAVSTMFASMQDDPNKFADLQRAKKLMGLGEPLTSTVSDEQVRIVLQTLCDLPRPADRNRIARSLDLMGDGPFHDELQKQFASISG